jgi:hypothetical protein
MINYMSVERSQGLEARENDKNFQSTWEAFESLGFQLELGDRWFDAHNIFELTRGVNYGKAEKLTNVFSSLEDINSFLREALRLGRIKESRLNPGQKIKGDGHSRSNNEKDGYMFVVKPAKDKTVNDTSRRETLNQRLGSTIVGFGSGPVYPDSVD